MRLWPILLVALIWVEPACHKAQQVETKPSDEAKSEQPGLFTISQDQLARLKTTQVRTTNWQVAVHTTGTVDWDADHTTQAITQVNGPITRILVDHGHAGKEGRAAAVRLQPRRSQRHRHLPQGAQPRSLQQADCGPHEGTAGPRAPSR